MKAELYSFFEHSYFTKKFCYFVKYVKKYVMWSKTQMNQT